MLSFRAPVTFGEADDLLAVAGLTGEADRPERSWLPLLWPRPGRRRACFRPPSGPSPRRKPASAFYTPAALEHDVAGLAGRFGSGHHHLGLLSGEYRADRKAVASFTRDGIGRDDAQRFLGLAAAWKQAADALAAAESEHAPVLAPVYDGQRARTSTGSTTPWRSPPPPSAGPAGRT